MSKVVMSLPKGMWKNTILGSLLSLAAYVLLQLVTALMIHREVLGEESLYPAVCVSAGLASFIGCGYSVWKGRGASMLTVSAVSFVFLGVTTAVALLASETIAIENGLTGVGLSMVAGGLAAALIGSGLLCRDTSGHRVRRKKRHRTVNGTKA